MENVIRTRRFSFERLANLNFALRTPISRSEVLRTGIAINQLLVNAVIILNEHVLAGWPDSHIEMCPTKPYHYLIL